MLYVFNNFQNQTIKQNREKDKLKATHDKQMEELSKDIDNVSWFFQTDNMYIENDRLTVCTLFLINC